MSTLDSRTGWRLVIWSCAAARGPLLTRYYLVETRWGFWTNGEWMDYRAYGRQFCD